MKEKDSSGYTVSERILMLFSKNIPYYVGPVGKGSQNGWAEIREEGQILPVEYGTKARHGKNIRAFYHESGQGMYISVRGKGITETVVAV